MNHCKITDYHFDDSEESKKEHQQLLAKAARGALPKFVQAAMKDAGWAVVTGGSILNPNIDASKMMICFAYWARSKQQGIADKDFEEFMLDRLYFVENKAIAPEAAWSRISKWAKFEA